MVGDGAQECAAEREYLKGVSGSSGASIVQRCYMEIGQHVRAGRTLNMWFTFVRLEVLKLSGWSNADAP